MKHVPLEALCEECPHVAEVHGTGECYAQDMLGERCPCRGFVFAGVVRVLTFGGTAALHVAGEDVPRRAAPGAPSVGAVTYDPKPRRARQEYPQ